MSSVCCLKTDISEFIHICILIMNISCQYKMMADYIYNQRLSMIAALGNLVTAQLTIDMEEIATSLFAIKQKGMLHGL